MARKGAAYQHLEDGATSDQFVEAGQGNVELETPTNMSRRRLVALVSGTIIMLLGISVMVKRNVASINGISQHILQLHDDVPSWATASFRKAVSHLAPPGYFFYSSSDFQTCHQSSSEKCPMSKMDKLTLVYPGAPTTCLNGEYAFFVYPGDPAKVLVFFQGGGACWDALSYHGKACTTSLDDALTESDLGAGIFNRSDTLNPYRHYTIVKINYCSGDAHTGNVTRKGWALKPVPQMGYRNANAAVTWIKKNSAQTISSLVVMGCSAGSLGTQAWAGYLLQGTLGYSTANVIADSFAGVFPPGTQPSVIQSFGACDLPIYTKDMQARCQAGNINIQALFNESIHRFPSVPFGNIQSKADATQIYFFDAVAFSFGKFEMMNLTGPELFFATNEMFQMYNKFTNYVEYYVDGDTHCFTPYSRYFTAGTKGPAAGSGDQKLIYQWTKQFRAVNSENGALPKTQCIGELKENAVANGDQYCDESLSPKRIALAGDDDTNGVHQSK